ncbi:MAG: transglutaminase-like cysteine peptidase [Bradyrhizobium sp.]|uniref:transglutaminase-like cysteine peptidase n=1 Tax=Bradyrhizobium sp. TaxID=376 RepID=UPI001D6084FF|nr:transglutaminase-like cysteine peptidase [Bradyrhizobium sp.]MBV9565484.1 transglutaminase-like cysteine peptidase [Bradyrhizobium sp.]
MARLSFAILPFAVVAGSLLSGVADARNRPQHDATASRAIEQGAPTLAPFQHVRFCLHNPAECKSDPAQRARIELNAETSQMLDRVNRSVNAAIKPTAKSYGSNLADKWTIAPAAGDCNDYAVTKRHELIAGGLPANALRLSVVKTASGVGHLVLVVATTRGDMVLDNLTQSILPWQRTDYQWLKIQSATDARFWYEVRSTGSYVARAERGVRLAFHRRQRDI